MSRDILETLIIFLVKFTRDFKVIIKDLKYYN